GTLALPGAVLLPCAMRAAAVHRRGMRRLPSEQRRGMGVGVQMQVEEQRAITPAQPSRDERLAAMVPEINAAHAECVLSLRDGLAHAIKAGQLLMAAKELLDYGAWLPWLRANFAGSTRNAQDYMRVARMYPELTATNNATGTFLGYRATL